MNEALYLVRLRLHAPSLLLIARRPAIAGHLPDLGYVVHCGLRELLGDAAPKPLVITSMTRSSVEVLAYSPYSCERLKSRASESGKTGVLLEVDSKRMPDCFREGLHLRFRVRACPVVRKGRGSPRSGAEVDAFLAHLEREGSQATVTREGAYCQWIRDAFARTGAVEIIRIRVAARRLVRVLRRNEQRSARSFSRPDVVFEGALRVRNSEAFGKLVRRGLGRHRAFGFGMLLLRK